MRRFRILLALMALMALTAGAGNKNYITRVLDYSPAPGQFINTTPQYVEGEPIDSLLARVLWNITGRYIYETYEMLDGTVWVDSTFSVQPGLISLGGYGGSVTFGFDHPVVNVPDALDLQIFGNAFTQTGSATAGSSEPGIVMVSRDVNGNGLADDPWYELAGSEYGSKSTYHHYEITYYRPDEGHVPVPQNPFFTDTQHIRWTAVNHDLGTTSEGYIAQNSFHKQSYWPQWVDEPTITISGALLPENFEDDGSGQNFVQDFKGWGYVDNRPDYNYEEALTDSISEICNMGFDIGWAVDEQGQRVKLPYIDFVKVYTALNQQLGWIGETSTEVKGAIDLHPDEPLPVEHKRGDVNDDGDVDAIDLNIMINILLGTDVADNYGGRADVNGDGTPDGNDLNDIINIILGK